MSKLVGGKKAEPKAETKAEPKPKAAGKPKRAPSAWIMHVKKYREEHGGLYKDAMKAAKATYKK
jgi:hypothetical protein